jgi:pimeloyl-ACP methyl ester carboxylesterase
MARSFGPPSGPLLVFIHGWEGRGSQFGQFFQPAIEKGFQILAWDGPAHGESPGKRTNLVEFSQALIEDLKFISTPVHAILGHSFGGGSCVLSHHFGLNCQKVVLIAAPARTQAVFDRFTHWIRLTPSAAHCFQKDVEKEAGMSVGALDLVELAKNYTIPCFIVHDTGDKDVPYPESVEMHQAWKNSLHLKTTGLGHRKVLKSPEVISKILDFVSSH